MFQNQLMALSYGWLLPMFLFRNSKDVLKVRKVKWGSNVGTFASLHKGTYGIPWLPRFSKLKVLPPFLDCLGRFKENPLKYIVDWRGTFPPPPSRAFSVLHQNIFSCLIMGNGNEQWGNSFIDDKGHYRSLGVNCKLNYVPIISLGNSLLLCFLFPPVFL